MNELNTMIRSVKRCQIKDRAKQLEQVIRTHIPLIEAMKVTQKAYQEGVMEGLRQKAEVDTASSEVLGAKANKPTPEAAD